MNVPTVDLVAGGTVFAGPDLEPARLDVRIEDGRVAELLPPGSPIPEGASVLDASGAFVLPGFVDCHDHLRNVLPGYAFGVGLDIDAFLQVWWESQRLMGPTEYRLGATLGGVQRLRAGITNVVDHCYPYHRPDLDEAAVAGLGASGIKFAYARGIMTRPYEPLCESWDEAADRIRGVAGDGLVDPDHLFVAPVSLRQATPEEFGLAVELAGEIGAGLYTHVAETSAEVEMWQAQTGSRPITALGRLGFLGPRTVLVHCVELSDEEMDLLAESGTHVIHCPTNHMKLAKGFTPVPDLLARGVNVAIGIDMMADMLTEIRTEVGMHAVYRRTPDVVSKEDALAMATLHGARALGESAVTGSIETGKAADLVVIDGRNVDHGPVIDPRFAVVYTAHSGMIRDVLVDGRRVVADGACTTVDEHALLEEVESVVAAYLAKLGGGGLWWNEAG